MAKPDWRRMPASAVSVKEDGPDFVALRAKDARAYADELAEQATRAARSLASIMEAADEARATADRWEAATAAFTETWGT